MLALLAGVAAYGRGRPSRPAGGVRMQATTSMPPTAAQRPTSGGSSPGYMAKQKRDSAVNDQALRWYLSSIGTRRLLDNKEEIKLAMAIKELLRWQKVQRELEEELDRMPTRREWAVALGFSGADESLLRFESQLRLFQHAKDRMITANLRLVVSIAKKCRCRR